MSLLLPALMALLGVGIVVRTLAEGGGVTSVGILIGVLFLIAGAGRLYVEHRRA